MNLTNPLYISTFGQKDKLDIEFLNITLFTAISDNYSLGQNYKILNIDIPSQAISSEDANLIENMSDTS